MRSEALKIFWRSAPSRCVACDSNLAIHEYRNLGPNVERASVGLFPRVRGRISRWPRHRNNGITAIRFIRVTMRNAPGAESIARSASVCCVDMYEFGRRGPVLTSPKGEFCDCSLYPIPRALPHSKQESTLRRTKHEILDALDTTNRSRLT